MALSGGGAIAIWNDVKPGTDAALVEWHDREHIPERVGIPGFLRGRRFVALEGAPRYFILYETADETAAQSPAYFERLNNPTPWTAKANKDFLNTIRGICRVAGSLGHGEGGTCMTLRLDDAPGLDAAILAALPKLVAEPGMVAAHLLVAQREVSLIETNERIGRAPLRAPDRVVMLEGHSADALIAAQARHLAGFGGERGIYALQMARSAGHRD
jgi:hypothetical protein